MMRKIYLLLILIALPMLMASTNYNYSYWGESIHSAPGMTFAAYINAQSLGTTLASPEDIVVYEDDKKILDWQDPYPVKNFEYVGIGSWDVYVYYKDIKVS